MRDFVYRYVIIIINSLSKQICNALSSLKYTCALHTIKYNKVINLIITEHTTIHILKLNFALLN